MEHNPEFYPPPFSNIFKPYIYVPFLVYFAFFNVVSAVIRRFAWQNYSGFRQYRLQNLTVCVLHSVISGTWCLVVVLSNFDAMFNDILLWHSPIAEQLPILSIAYFVHDAIHMLKHEWSRWTLELLVHHVATCLALFTGMLPGRFLLSDYWALLMEVNSVFLHLRTIMQITGASKNRPRMFLFVILTNIVTFVLFRFIAQMKFAHWAWVNRAIMHPIYTIVGCGGEIVFLMINGVLFVRIIASDGFLGEAYKSKVATNRDENKAEEKLLVRNGKEE